VNATAALHTILLVEDEAIIALAQAAALKRHGYRVVTAYNGLDAVAKAEQDPDLDLILMDIDLGSGMDGTEAAQAILQRRDIPVVFLSSHTERDVVEKTEQITSYGYVVKNSGETVLIASIKMAYKLFESEQRYRFLFEQSPLGIIHFDDQGIIHDCNETYEKHTGIKRGMITGLSMFDLPDKDMVVEVKKALRGEGSVFERAYVTPIAKRSLWVRGFFAPFRTAGRGPVGGMGIFEDITQRHEAEAAREQSLQQFRALLDNLQGGVLVESADRVVTHANPSFCKIFDIPSPEILIGVDCAAAAQGASALFVDPPGFVREIRSILSRGASVVGQRLQLKDGRVLERDYVPVTIQAAFAGNMWIYRDITLRENALKQKEQSEEHYRTLIENLPGIVYLYSSKHGGLFWSPQVKAILGYSIEHLREHPFLWNESIHPDDRDAVSRAVASSTGFEIEYRIRDARGRWRVFLDRSIERRRENDELIIQGLAVDLTDRRGSP